MKAPYYDMVSDLVDALYDRDQPTTTFEESNLIHSVIKMLRWPTVHAGYQRAAVRDLARRLRVPVR